MGFFDRAKKKVHEVVDEVHDAVHHNHDDVEAPKPTIEQPLIPENPTGSKEDKAIFEKYSQKIAFCAYWVFTNVGASGFFGLAAGFATKHLFQWLAILIGVIFVIVQVLGWMGIVTVHWDKLKEQAMMRLDADGNGRVDMDDFKIITRKVLSVLTLSVPSIGGFCLGLFLGLRWG